MYSLAWLNAGAAKAILSQYAGREPFGGGSPSPTPIHRACQSASSSRPASSRIGSLHSLSPRSVHTLTWASAERRERSKTGTRTNDWTGLCTRPVSKPSSVRTR
jgi:hypothetical protein